MTTISDVGIGTTDLDETVQTFSECVRSTAWNVDGIDVDAIREFMIKTTESST